MTVTVRSAFRGWVPASLAFWAPNASTHGFRPRRITLGLVCLLTLLSGATAAPPSDNVREVRREQLTAVPWTGEEGDWIRQHVGLIFHDDGGLPRFSLAEQIEIAHALGVRKVKTWLKGERAGEMVEKLSRPIYRRLLAEFDTVLFDVCPDFVLPGPYDEQKSRTIRAEYDGVAYHLASHYRDPKKTFLLSLFMETNLFFGTERSYHPDLPADRFFRDAAAGVRAGLARARKEAPAGPRVFTVIEVANLPTDFIRRYLPRTHADLYALSYYGRGELGQPDVTLADCLDALAAAVPHDGPFGARNLMLGELGRSVFAGGHEGEDREQLEYLRQTLTTARQRDLAYAFVFWLTDQERSPDDGWGLVASKRAGGALRRSWHAFRRVFRGRMPAGRPARPQVRVDAVRPLRWNPEPGQTEPVEIDLSNRSSWSTRAAAARDVAVRVVGGGQVTEARLALAPDELVTLRAEVPAPADSKLYVMLLTPDSISDVVQTVSLERADLVVDRVYTEPAHPKPGERVQLLAAVRNIGKAPITDFAVHFHVDDFHALWVSWGCIYGDTKLGPDQALPIAGGFPWIATPGTHRLRAWANPDGGREADYTNNIGYGEVTVQGGA
jgi:hypothetical protein